MVTIKRVEYEEMRHSEPRYIKDYSILERKKESNELHRIIKIDKTPTTSHALFFRNNELAIKFPFLLDYNALINELDDFQIYLYENRKAFTGLNSGFGKANHLIIKITVQTKEQSIFVPE